MAKRGKGIALVSLGCALLIAAGGWLLYNVAEDRNAGQQAATILDKLDDAGLNADETNNKPVVLVDGETFCGRVRIDKLGVELPVYDEWSYARLKSAPCRYTGGIDTNDMIIAAHNYQSHFGELHKLAIGDEITFIDAYGQTHWYEVRERTTLDGTAVSDMRAGGWDFTLFTCTRSGEQRVTIRCEKQ